jgi:putative restriction endonuclease
MPPASLPDYLRLTRANGRAPHKPVLLLAVLRAFDEGLIIENRIEPSAELINLFNGYWQALVHDDKFQRRFYLPFFHLKNERSGLWTLHTLPGFDSTLTRGRDVKSLSTLINFAAYGELRRDVYERWLIAANRSMDRQALMATYFVGEELPEELPDRIGEIAALMVSEPAGVYIPSDPRLSIDEKDEELTLRGGAFKRKIPELYEYRCAITGLRVQNRRAVNLIDACHIVPRADSFDDTIGNGIALCPNMHRAFDRGLISIAADHSVLVTPDLLESASSHAIRPFAGKRLMLPNEKRCWPAPENLARHRERWGF